MNIDFNQARAKHTFFKTRVRGFLLGSDASTDSFKTYLSELGDWVNKLASQHQLSFNEVMEANYLHNELAAHTNKLITLRSAGREADAKQKFQEIEATGQELIKTLSSLEERINRE